MKIRTVIADDEIHALEGLSKIMERIDDIEITGKASNGEDAVNLINLHKPDLVLLDIQMPVYNGIEILEKIERNIGVIFITAYDHYAVKAFEESAIDYILKPYPESRVLKAIDKFRLHRRIIDSKAIQQLKEIFKEKSYLRTFPVKTADEVLIIQEEDTFYFKADNKYVMLYTKNSRFITDFTITELESKLSPEKFIRIHRGTIIAISRIDRIKKWFNSEYIVQLKDDNNTRLKVSRSYQSDFRSRLNF